MLVIFLILLLTGCTVTGDRLSGSAFHRDPGIAYPTSLDHIHIGVTTKGDVRNLFGNPTDIQLSSDHSPARESWAYAKASPSIHPLQYVPGFGALALPKHHGTASFSISFSSDGVVEGIALREVQPYGEPGASLSAWKSPSVIHPYGRNNPLVHLSRHDASYGSGISGE